MGKYLRELYLIFVSTALSHVLKDVYDQGYKAGVEVGIRMETRRQKDEERNKDDALLTELEGYIMGYLRDTFKEKTNGPTLH